MINHFCYQLSLTLSQYQILMLTGLIWTLPLSTSFTYLYTFGLIYAFIDLQNQLTYEKYLKLYVRSMDYLNFRHMVAHFIVTQNNRWEQYLLGFDDLYLSLITLYLAWSNQQFICWGLGFYYSLQTVIKFKLHQSKWLIMDKFGQFEVSGVMGYLMMKYQIYPKLDSIMERSQWSQKIKTLNSMECKLGHIVFSPECQRCQDIRNYNYCSRLFMTP